MWTDSRRSGRTTRLRPLLLAAFAASMILGARSAEAQFGFGGFGGYGFNYQPPEVGFLNQVALGQAARATMGPVQNSVYAGNPNSYISRMNQDTSFNSYDVGTRRQIEASVGRYSDGPPPSYYRSHPKPAPTQAAAPAAPAAPSLPLASFFDRYQKLVWPGESPTFGDLGAKRGAADQACLAALNDYNLNGLAHLSTVNEARAKLIDYGKPALSYLQVNSTPRVADTFHLFLLSLYEGLAQAATVPKPAAPAANPAPNPTPPSAPRP
jgi:hypothetical protein